MEFLFDSRTLSFLGAILGITAALVMAVLTFLLRQRQWGFMLWMWAFMFIALGQSFGAARLLMGLNLSGGPANLFFLFGTILMVRGVRFFAKAPMHWQAHVAALVLALLSIVGTLVFEWPEVMRPLTYAALEVSLMLELMWLLLVRPLPERVRSAGRFLGSLALVYAGLFAAIGWSTAQLARQGSPLASPVLTVSFLSASAGVFVLIAGMVAMQAGALGISLPSALGFPKTRTQ